LTYTERVNQQLEEFLTNVLNSLSFTLRGFAQPEWEDDGDPEGGGLVSTDFMRQDGDD